ncbi:heavy metal translocating P-type ATPase [uncultured Paraglaciecola sp.]|uniref:heavy metal translocating P-type ATPase n=1 Tax=uncultured Paraglaciecola sp. TaxID=1765024 RepID=UPI0030D6E0EE|tara:strand:+ start:198299 stop:200668 length:2370 start_codon:yes stop_codon:yes gene_type:complete
MSDNCFHCGLQVTPQFTYRTQVMGKQQVFCCPGCCAVAEAIVNNGLEDYYHYRSEFAEKASENEDNLLDKLKVFDDDNILQEFIEANDNAREIQLTISGINCAACGWLIEKQLAKIQGIMKVGVNVSARRATVSWDNQQIKFSQILSHIEKIGYHAKPFQAEQHEATFRQENKDFLKRLGLAGLMTMQVMMLNIGVFFDLFGHIDAQTKQYFNWISLFLTTPVILYSASEFYSSAWRALRSKMVNMDVPITLALSLTYVSGVFATVQNNGQTYFESLCMFVFFLLTSRYLEHSARYKASQLSANMLEYMPTTATLIAGDKLTPVLAKSLVAEQLVLVKSGEMVPVDGEIIEGQGQLDEAMLTGEFDLVSKTIGETVFAGTVNQLGTLTIKVNKSLKHSMLNQINMLQNKALLNKPKIATLADQFSQYFVMAVLVISLCSYIIWLQIDASQALWITISILIATCPCALGLATPSALSCAMAHLNSKGVLLKRADSLEQISQVDWVALDKTGTLTEGKFTLAECICAENQDKERCLELAASLEQFSSHPIAKAFREIAHAYPVTDFSAQIGQGVTGNIDGDSYKLGSLHYIDVEVPTQMQSCNVFLACQGKVLCGFLLTDKVRSTSVALINDIKAKHLVLLSGDIPAVVEDVAKTLNIPHWLAQQTPEDKLSVIKQAQTDKHVVLMVGDGINDGPVLAQADVSVTLGAGSDLAKSSADVILLDNSLEKISLVFAIAKRCKVKIIQNMSWALGYNLLVLPLAVCGLLSPWMAVVGMSLSSFIVVVNSIRLLK